ncbi:MAG: YkgJ family cysteine cluster protein [archaeon]
MEELANKARKSISNYCINECSAYCCRKGFLIVTEKELFLIKSCTDKDINVFVKSLENGNFSLYMGNSKFPCPSLDKNFSCKIHRKNGRPKICKDFPLFIKDGTVFLSERCFAVKNNMFYPYIIEFERRGFKIHKYSDIESLDIFNII